MVLVHMSNPPSASEAVRPHFDHMGFTLRTFLRSAAMGPLRTAFS